MLSKYAGRKNTGGLGEGGSGVESRVHYKGLRVAELTLSPLVLSSVSAGHV